MKCEIVRSDIEVSPEFAHVEPWAGMIDWIEVVRNQQPVKRPFWKRGAILEHPEAFWLVRQGCAKPADEACALRANRNPEQQAAAQKAYERLSKGIHPDDFDLYDAGIIAGYDAKGDYLPGENYHLMAKKRSNLILPESTDEDDE